MLGMLTFNEALALKHAPEPYDMAVQEAAGDDPCTLYVRGLEADVDRDTLAAMFQVWSTCALQSSASCVCMAQSGVLAGGSPDESGVSGESLLGGALQDKALSLLTQSIT